MATITEIQYYCFLFILWFISTLLVRSFLKKPTNPRTSLQLPPAPPAIPIIGHIHLLGPIIHQSFQNLARRYGPVINLRIGATQCVLVSSAAMANEIFKTHDLIFAARPKFGYSDEHVYGNSGFLTAPYGDYWRFMKKLCMTELLGNRQLNRSIGVRREEIQRFLQKLLEGSRSGKPIDVGAEIMTMSNNIICRMVMSTRCSGSNNEAEKCRKLVRETAILAGKLCFGEVLGPLSKLGWLWYRKQVKDVANRFDELIETIFKEHEGRKKEEGNEKDLMDILIEIYQDEKVEVKITRTQIKAFILELFIAGTDTSAETSQWALALLINHPDVLMKLREEIDMVVGKTRLVQESDIPNLPYLQAVMKETLRLYPGAPVVVRECTQNAKIGGFDVPKKANVAINLYAIMRDSQSWEDPDEFQPERFKISSKESSDDQIDTKVQHFDYVPFGGGRRACPGVSLAMNMMHATIGAMVQCFDWKVYGDKDGTKKVDMKQGSGMALGMARPLICLPISRPASTHL